MRDYDSLRQLGGYYQYINIYKDKKISYGIYTLVVVYSLRNQSE